MKFLNIGPLELVFILILAFIILGPNEAVNTTRKIGGWIRKIVRSPEWSTVLNTSKEFRELPKKIINEAGLEDSINEIKQDADEISKGINQTIEMSSKEMETLQSKAAQDTGAEESINEIKEEVAGISKELNQQIEMTPDKKNPSLNSDQDASKSENNI